MRWDDEGQSRHASTEKILESIHSSLALLLDANRTTTQLQTHLVQRSGNPLSFLARSYIYCSDFIVQAHCGWAWLSERASECRFATAAWLEVCTLLHGVTDECRSCSCMLRFQSLPARTDVAVHSRPQDFGGASHPPYRTSGGSFLRFK